MAGENNITPTVPVWRSKPVLITAGVTVTLTTMVVMTAFKLMEERNAQMLPRPARDADPDEWVQRRR